MTKNFKTDDAYQTPRVTLPPVGEDDAFIGIGGVALLVGMSPSWIHDAVRKGELPAPVIRAPRCTRWRVGDVRSWLKHRAQSANTVGVETIQRAKAASDAAKAKRLDGASSS